MAWQAVGGTPVEIRRAVLHSMRRLLARMPLAGYAAAVLHPLLRVLGGTCDELRRDAADTLCAVALPLGPDFALFVPTIRKASPGPYCGHCQKQLKSTTLLRMLCGC